VVHVEERVGALEQGRVGCERGQARLQGGREERVEGPEHRRDEGEVPQLDRSEGSRYGECGYRCGSHHVGRDHRATTIPAIRPDAGGKPQQETRDRARGRHQPRVPAHGLDGDPHERHLVEAVADGREHLAAPEQPQMPVDAED
jgi:hypothetical protein